MANRFSDFKQSVYRALKYRLLRPVPPPLPFEFEGPVVVVGSAPVSNKPAGMDERFSVITINGSQSVASRWGVDVPDITFMMFNQIEGTTPNAIEVRRVLSGRRTKQLFVFLWRKNQRAQLERGLRAFDYAYDELYIIDRYERMALLDKAAGLRSLEICADTKVSNGINAVLFALHHRAPAVIITGIDPGSNGHAYNQIGLQRLHARMDQALLERLRARGAPIFTADAAVSESSGIPLWTGSVPVAGEITVPRQAGQQQAGPRASAVRGSHQEYAGPEQG